MANHTSALKPVGVYRNELYNAGDPWFYYGLAVLSVDYNIDIDPTTFVATLTFTRVKLIARTQYSSQVGKAILGSATFFNTPYVPTQQIISNLCRIDQVNFDVDGFPRKQDSNAKVFSNITVTDEDEYALNFVIKDNAVFADFNPPRISTGNTIYYKINQTNKAQTLPVTVTVVFDCLYYDKVFGWIYDSSQGSTQTITTQFNVAIPASPDIFEISFVSPLTASNVPSPMLKRRGVSIIIPNVPTKEGYTCFGWSKSSAAQEVDYKAGDVFTLDADTTLYAVWKRNVVAEVASVFSNRVNESGNYDDTSTYARTTAAIYVQSVWKTETHISIEAAEANVDTPTEPIKHASTIFPSDTLSKPEDDYTSMTTIRWDSIDDAIEFIADKSYNVTVKADVYRVKSGVPFAEGYIGPLYPPRKISVDDTPFTQSFKLTLGDEDSEVVSVQMPDYELPTEDDLLPAIAYLSKNDGLDVELAIARPPLSAHPELYPRVPTTASGFTTDAILINVTDGTETREYYFDMPANFPDKIGPYDEQAYFVDISACADDISQDGVEYDVYLPMRMPDVVYPSPDWAGCVKYASVIHRVTDDHKQLVLIPQYPMDIPAYVPAEWRGESVQIEFTYRAEDAKELVASTSAHALLLDAEFIMDFHESGKGMAIGGIAPSDGLDIGWKTKFFEVVEAAKELVVKGATTLHQTLIVNGATTVKGLLTATNGVSLEKDVSIWGTLTSADINLRSSSNKISRGGAGGSWISGRNNAFVKTTNNTSSTSWFPVTSTKTPSGSWETGVLGENFYFSYASDSNYNAGKNETYTHMIPATTSRVMGYWDTSTSYAMPVLANGGALPGGYIRTPSSGIIPTTSGGSGSCGTAGWPWNEVSTNALRLGGNYMGGNGYSFVHHYTVTLTSGSVANHGTATLSGTVTVSANVIDAIAIVNGLSHCVSGTPSATKSGNVVTVKAELRNIWGSSTTLVASYKVLCRTRAAVVV